MTYKLKVLPLLISALAIARAEITYVDATHGPAGNTYATGGSSGSTSWLDITSNSAATNSSKWVLRTPLGTDGTIYQALHTGNAIPELVTEITGLADGDYDLWVFFWDGPNANTWTISAGLESGSLTTYSFDGPGNTSAPVAASTLTFTGTPPLLSEDPRILYGVKIGQSNVAGGAPIRVYVSNLVGGGSATRTWYDGIGHASASSQPPTLTTGPRVLGIDFNLNDALASPSQSLLRVVSGSTNQAANSSSYTKNFGTQQLKITQPNGAHFEFRGANGDNTRAIPGGNTSRSFLVSDFIATREGALDLEITGLAPGDYIFRSYHLDTLISSGLGFAQGASPTTPNTIEALLDGVVVASVQPTALGPKGLGTTSINDSQIPMLEFAFTQNETSPLMIKLRSTLSNNADSFLLLNGFEIFQNN